jgi:hypothetical protein
VQREVLRVVDRGLHSQGAALFQVGLGLGGPVVDLQLGGDVAGDDLGGEPARCLVRSPVDDPAVDHQRDPLGPTEIEMGADGGFEPCPSPAGLVEHGGV